MSGRGTDIQNIGSLWLGQSRNACMEKTRMDEESRLTLFHGRDCILLYVRVLLYVSMFIEVCVTLNSDAYVFVIATGVLHRASHNTFPPTTAEYISGNACCVYARHLDCEGQCVLPPCNTLYYFIYVIIYK